MYKFMLGLLALVVLSAVLIVLEVAPMKIMMFIVMWLALCMAILLGECYYGQRK